ncbi:TlpA disulfide reductase family protein [Streptomyces sp. NPDC050610]|uniref:TlpA family protein disulfide reductase n=1 Tax=Streptomyces sp. NPDC050610 TaxID=3157097 RepID=UPI0034384567
MSARRAPRRPTRHRRAAVLAVGAATAALVLSACGTENAAKGGGDTKFVQGTGGISVVKNKSDRQSAPDLVGKSLEGKRLDLLKDFKGKIIAFNVWGSWCTPCRAEAPNLTKVANEYKDKGVEFVGLNTRDTDTAPALSFEKRYEVPYPSYHDPAGKLLLRFPKGSLNPQFIPSTIFIDRDGNIAARAPKALSVAELRETLDPLVAEK